MCVFIEFQMFESVLTKVDLTGYNTTIYMGVKTLTIIWSIIFGAYLSIFIYCVSSLVVYLLCNYILPVDILCNVYVCYYTISVGRGCASSFLQHICDLFLGLTKYFKTLMMLHYIKHFHILILSYLS